MKDYSPMDNTLVNSDGGDGGDSGDACNGGHKDGNGQNKDEDGKNGATMVKDKS